MVKFRICFVLGFALLLIGCTAPSKFSDPALAHIYEKYGCEFTPVSYAIGDSQSESRSIECIAPGLDSENERVVVEVRCDATGKTVFRDNYVSYLVRPELEEYLSEMISPEFSEFKLFTTTDGGMLPDELGRGTTLSDLYSAYPGYRVTIRVFVRGGAIVPESLLQTAADLSAEEFASRVRHIETRLLVSGHSYSISLFVVDDTVYSKVSRYNFGGFWDYYVNHMTPDGKLYFHSYEMTKFEGALYIRSCLSYCG